MGKLMGPCVFQLSSANEPFMSDNCEKTCGKCGGLENKLFYEVKYGTLEEVKHLMNNFKNELPVENESGNTLLHLAAINGRIDIVRFLVSHMEKDPLNKDNMTPLDYARY